MAKMQLLVDEKGIVLGTALVEAHSDDAPEMAGMEAGIAQHVVQIEVDDKLVDELTVREHPARLHAHMRTNFLG